MRKLILSRCLSTTSLASKNAPYMLPRKEQREAQKNLSKHKYFEVVESQKIRAKWEYPVQPDQKATWKHRRWFDTHIKKWVDTSLSLPKHFKIGYKDKRSFIFEAETPYDFFDVLLNSYRKKKYVVESFDFETPISNISYYYQYLTNTKYIHGLPFSIVNTTVDDTYFANFRSFVNDLLLLEYNNSNYENIEPYQRSSRIAAATMKAIMNYLVATLSSKNSILTNCEMDHNVHNCMFWFRGVGFLKWTLPLDHPVALQCHDPSFMQIRTKQPLQYFSPMFGEFSTTGNLPTFYTTPHVFKYPLQKYRNTITPGYRLYGGDCHQNYQYAMEEELLSELPPPTYNECRYGHTQMLLLPETYSREWYKENLEHADITGEIEEHLKGKGIMSGWVWTAAQALFMHHWMDKDIEKPFCSQLYDEISSNEVVGLNDDALLLLIKFIRNGLHENNVVLPTDEELEEYNASLTVQVVDPESPDIEDQKPLHKLKMFAEREAKEAELRKIEDEKKSWRDRMIEKIM